MQKMKVNELKPHPKNDYYFDDIQGQKWNEFLESVKTSGIIEPIICNQNKVVISGHQRLRACKELGIKEVLVDTRIYDDEQKELKDLIETNIRQRGDINSSGLKLGRIIKTLENANEIKKGNNQYNEDSDNVGNLTQEELAKQLNISVDTLNNYKKLTTLIPELQELSLDNSISTSVASRVLARLSQDEQNKILEELGVDRLKEMTQKEVKEYIEKNKQLEQELQQEKNKPKETITETIDNTDYTLKKKFEETQKELERIKRMKALIEDELKASKEVANAYKEDSVNYHKMKSDIDYLTKQKDDLGRQIESITSISGLVVDIKHLLDTLSPIKYSRAILEAKDDEIVIENLSTIIESVRNWCDDMEQYIPREKDFVEII